jgi:dephospho-CoA kinase
MPTIALTGNFGMGKTSVLHMFSKLGAHTFDVDSFVHDILTKPNIIRKIEKILGNNIKMNGSSKPSIDKKRVAEIIFADSDKRKAVENVIHPLVLKAMEKTESGIFQKDRSAIVIFEVPLLFETGYDKFFDKTIVIWCNRSTAVDRLSRKGFSAEEALKRFKAQMPITKKKALADFVIDNNQNLTSTQKRVKKIYKDICSG